MGHVGPSTLLPMIYFNFPRNQRACMRAARCWCLSRAAARCNQSVLGQLHYQALSCNGACAVTTVAVAASQCDLIWVANWTRPSRVSSGAFAHRRCTASGPSKAAEEAGGCVWGEHEQVRSGRGPWRAASSLPRAAFARRMNSVHRFFNAWPAALHWQSNER